MATEPIQIAPSPARRATLQRRVRWLVSATIGYNLIEAAVALTAGTLASSTALLGFGLDSLIEVSSATALAWQFTSDDPQLRERTTLRMIAASFFALAGYITVQAVRALTGHGEARPSPVGLALAGASLLVMPVLCPTCNAAPVENSAPAPRSPTPNKPCCAPTCPRSYWPASPSTLCSAGPGPIRSPP